MHALIAKRESQSTLILIYVSQTSTEMEQSGIEVGVRAMKKKRGARCCLQQTDSSLLAVIGMQTIIEKKQSRIRDGCYACARIAKHESQRHSYFNLCELNEH